MAKVALGCEVNTPTSASVLVYKLATLRKQNRVAQRGVDPIAAPASAPTERSRMHTVVTQIREGSKRAQNPKMRWTF